MGSRIMYPVLNKKYCNQKPLADGKIHIINYNVSMYMTNNLILKNHKQLVQFRSFLANVFWAALATVSNIAHT